NVARVSPKGPRASQRAQHTARQGMVLVDTALAHVGREYGQRRHFLNSRESLGRTLAQCATSGDDDRVARVGDQPGRLVDLQRARAHTIERPSAIVRSARVRTW